MEQYVRVDQGGWISGPSMSPWQAELVLIRQHWGEDYEVSYEGGMFRAIRRGDGAALSDRDGRRMYELLVEDVLARG
jgi:hypothetical protein